MPIWWKKSQEPVNGQRKNCTDAWRPFSDSTILLYFFEWQGEKSIQSNNYKCDQKYLDHFLWNLKVEAARWLYTIGTLLIDTRNFIKKMLCLPHVMWGLLWATRNTQNIFIDIVGVDFLSGPIKNTKNYS